MALADFLQALLKQPGGPQAALAQAASDQGSAGPNGSAAYQNALQAAFQQQQQPQSAPQMPALGVSPQTTGAIPSGAPSAPAAVSGPTGGSGLGGLLSGLENVFNPQARGRNATIQYLTNKGYDPGTAQIIAADKPLLRQALIGGTKVSDFDQRAQAARSYGLTPGTEDFRNFVLTGKIGDGLLPADVEAQKIRIARESRPETNINLPNPDANMFAGLPKDVRDEMFKRQGAAQDAADLINVTNQGLQLLDQGAITGAGSGAKVAAIKWAQTLGVPVPDDLASVVNNTEAYRSIMAKAVGKVIKNFGSGTGLSDADRQYAERLAGGDTTLNEPAIRRILAAGAKQSQQQISSYTAMRDRVLKGDLGAMLNVNEPAPYASTPQSPSPSAPTGSPDLSKMPAPEGVDPNVWAHVPNEKRKLWTK